MKLIGKTLICTLVLIIASMLGGALLSALPLKPPLTPWATPPVSVMIAWMSLGSLVLVAGLVPIASGIGGRLSIRYCALAALLFIGNAVNTVIEMSIFTAMGGQTFLLLQFLISFAVTAAALAWFFDSQQPASSLPQMAISSWAWRVLVAWLAFPFIYLLFGMFVGPFVIEYYKSGAMGLQLPPMDVILRTQLVRSLLFLGCSLPVIRLWTGSRWRLVFALGMAHAVMVGLYGLSQAYWMPSIMRVLHSVEITADSFAYAFVLTWLFFPRTHTATAPGMPVHVTSTTAA